ncbi:MAG: hypothetical protein V4718_12795 [Pseudomonadota bacterium]
MKFSFRSIPEPARRAVSLRPGLFFLLFSFASVQAQPSAPADDLRLIGVIEQSKREERPGQAPRALLAFGLIGGLLYSGVNGSKAQTNQYEILTATAETVTLQTDQDMPIGACVAIVPDGVLPGNFYPYGMVSMTLSTRCAENGLSPAK